MYQMTHIEQKASFDTVQKSRHDMDNGGNDGDGGVGVYKENSYGAGNRGLSGVRGSGSSKAHQQFWVATDNCRDELG